MIPHIYTRIMMIQTPEVSNQITLACEFLRTGSFIIFSCYNKGSIHWIGLIQHFELPLRQNSTLWDNFYNRNICSMSRVFVILSHTDCVTQFSLSTLITPFCREVHEERSFIRSHKSLKIYSHQTTFLRACMPFWERPLAFINLPAMVSWPPDCLIKR